LQRSRASARSPDQPYSVTVRYKDWRKYAQGVYPAAECFPYLTEEDRGILITGCIERDSGL